MRIILTVEVQSREALAAILNAGIKHAEFDCRVTNLTVLTDWAVIYQLGWKFPWLVINTNNGEQRDRYATHDAARTKANELNT